MAKKRYHQSKKSRMHEERGEEKYLRGPVKRDKYDTLRHERNMHNDEHHHDSAPEASGPYHYDREERASYRRGMIAGEYYAGAEPRRRQEMYDAGMIHEDHRAIANMPQEVMIKQYPKPDGYLPEDLDDTLRGIDRQIGIDNEKKMQHFFPKKV